MPRVSPPSPRAPKCTFQHSPNPCPNAHSDWFPVKNGQWHIFEAEEQWAVRYILMARAVWHGYHPWCAAACCKHMHACLLLAQSASSRGTVQYGHQTWFCVVVWSYRHTCCMCTHCQAAGHRLVPLLRSVQVPHRTTLLQYYLHVAAGRRQLRERCDACLLPPAAAGLRRHLWDTPWASATGRWPCRCTLACRLAPQAAPLTFTMPSRGDPLPGPLLRWCGCSSAWCQLLKPGCVHAPCRRCRRLRPAPYAVRAHDTAERAVGGLRRGRERERPGLPGARDDGPGGHRSGRRRLPLARYSRWRIASAPLEHGLSVCTRSLC